MIKANTEVYLIISYIIVEGRDKEFIDLFLYILTVLFFLFYGLNF